MSILFLRKLILTVRTRHGFDTIHAIMSTSDSENTLVTTTTTDSSSDPSVWEEELDWEEPHDTSDEIYLFDREHMDAPRRHLQYCIGTFWYERFTIVQGQITGPGTGLFLGVSISERAFFHYDYQAIMQYAVDYNMSMGLLPRRLEILQIVVESSPDGFESYKVVVKTFWLRLVQRRWKRIYRERQHVFKVRTSWRNLRYSQLRGRHLPGYNIVPGVLGMMTVPHIISGSTGT